jgi:large subunit ribosomal protein L13
MRTVTIRKEDLQPGEKFAPDWLLIDAKGRTLGRLASEIAFLLRGKHKPIFTPHLDTGDFVIVINADKVKLTGKKLTDKYYFHHTGFPGGVKAVQAEKLFQKKPTEVLRIAVKRMLPKNALNRQIIHKLKLYAGVEHPHAAQQPKPYSPKYAPSA